MESLFNTLPGHPPHLQPFSIQGFSGFLSRGAMEKFAQRIGGDEDWPSRNRDDDGKEQRFNGKFPTLFAREITSG
jgi:hypothetical protein